MADSHASLPQPSLFLHCVQTPFVAQDPPKPIVSLGNFTDQDQPKPQLTPGNQTFLDRDEVKPQIVPGNPEFLHQIPAKLVSLGNQAFLDQDQPKPQLTPGNQAFIARDEVKPQVVPGNPEFLHQIPVKPQEIPENEASDAAHASAPSSSTGGTSQAATIYKNRLQEYAQHTYSGLPSYHTVNEGLPHAPKFRSTVEIFGLRFTSSTTFLHRKSAEQDVARIALEVLPPQVKAKNDECPVDINECPPIPDLRSCKSILHEYAFKKCFKISTYETSPLLLQGQQQPIFESSLILNGVRYTAPGKNKKEAEQLTAHSAIRSLLGTEDRVLYEIIRSKNISSDACPTGKTVPDQNNTLQGGGSNNSVQDGANVAACNLVMPISLDNLVQGGVNAAGHNDVMPSIRGKEVETMAPIVKSDLGSPLVAKHPGPCLEANQPHHDYKKPKLVPPSSSVTNNLPIAFVSPVSAPPIEEVSRRAAKNRQKNQRRRNNKRLQGGVSQPISAVHPCPALLDRPMNAAT